MDGKWRAIRWVPVRALVSRDWYGTLSHLCACVEVLAALQLLFSEGGL